jgi:hypothetical protein
MKRFLAAAFLVLVVGIFFVSAAFAEMTFNYGASERIRQEIWDNLLDLKTLAPNNTDKDRNFFRFKTSLWGSGDFDKNTGIYLKFTSEVYYNIGPYRQPSGEKANRFVKLDENEGIVDNLYFRADNAFLLPVDLKIGRQDFLGPDMYGEGFLILDGNPNDGSRSFYFNAARARWRITANHSVDFVYITDQFEDTYLPTWRTSVPDAGTYFHDKKILNASNEQAFVVYGRDKLTDNLTAEPYYIYKREEKHPIGPPTPGLDLNTIGARAVYQMDPWTVGGEFAHQFGQFDNGRDRSAYGGYIFGSRKFKDTPLKPEFELRFVYLSGDDPKTKKDENWDPLFSRAPYWNELLIYTQIYETIKEGYAIPGYWTNSQLFMAKATMDVTPDTKVALSYQYWRANELAQTLAKFQPMFGTGHERGHLPTAFITHKFSKNIDAFFQYEYFVPGKFYADSAKNGQFLRWQLQFKI